VFRYVFILLICIFFASNLCFAETSNDELLQEIRALRE